MSTHEARANYWGEVTEEQRRFADNFCEVFSRPVDVDYTMSRFVEQYRAVYDPSDKGWYFPHGVFVCFVEHSGVPHLRFYFLPPKNKLN